MAQKGFSGEKRQTFVSLKKAKQAHVAYSTNATILGPYLLSLLADGKIQRGAGIQGDAAQGKWVSRLRGRGQLSIQFPRSCPLWSCLQMQWRRVPVLQNYLPWSESKPQPLQESFRINTLFPFLASSSCSFSSSSVVIWGV